MEQLVTFILKVTKLTPNDIFVFEKNGFVIKYISWTSSQKDELAKLATQAFGSDMEVKVSPTPTVNKKTGAIYEPSTIVQKPFVSTEADVVAALQRMKDAS